MSSDLGNFVEQEGQKRLSSIPEVKPVISVSDFHVILDSVWRLVIESRTQIQLALCLQLMSFTGVRPRSIMGSFSYPDKYLIYKDVRFFITKSGIMLELSCWPYKGRRGHSV